MAGFSLEHAAARVACGDLYHDVHSLLPAADRLSLITHEPDGCGRLARYSGPTSSVLSEGAPEEDISRPIPMTSSTVEIYDPSNSCNDRARHAITLAKVTLRRVQVVQSPQETRLLETVLETGVVARWLRQDPGRLYRIARITCMRSIVPHDPKALCRTRSSIRATPDLCPIDTYGELKTALDGIYSWTRFAVGLEGEGADQQALEG